MQKRRLISKIGAIALAAAMAATSVIPAFASPAYTAVAGTSTTFKKYLIVPEDARIPALTTSFTVAPGQAISLNTADNSVMQVNAGVGTPTIADVTFTSDQATFTEAGSNIDVARPASARADGLTAATGVELQAGEKYAVSTATVDFSGCRYNEPGIYRYVVTETASAANAAKGVMNDNDTDRILDVYVVDNNGSLAVAAYVMHTNANDVAINTNMGAGDVSTAGAALNDKTDGFTNEWTPVDLVFKKEVTGNGASRDKVFEFTLKLSDLTAGDKYTVSLANDNNANTVDGSADATSASTTATRESNRGKTNVTELVAGANGTIEQKFYLSHGQYIAVKGLPRNASYEVTEDREDYKSTEAAASGYTDPVKSDKNDAAKANIGAIATENVVKTSYVNSIDSIIPTGVKTAVQNAVILMAVAAIVTAAVVYTRKKFA